MNEESREVLLILQEECAEVTQAISKCFRFGPDQMKPGKDRTNVNMLEEEIGDLFAMVELNAPNQRSSPLKGGVLLRAKSPYRMEKIIEQNK